jgi:hypothetical protein
MTDIVITAANVVLSKTAAKSLGYAGEAVAAGKVGYLDAATQEYLLADSDSATAAAKIPTCMFLASAANDQPVCVAKAGVDVTLGAVLTAGLAYYLSNTPGGICPVEDVGSGERVVLIGVAKSTSVLHLLFTDTGVAN